MNTEYLDKRFAQLDTDDILDEVRRGLMPEAYECAIRELKKRGVSIHLDANVDSLPKEERRRDLIDIYVYAYIFIIVLLVVSLGGNFLSIIPILFGVLIRAIVLGVIYKYAIRLITKVIIPYKLSFKICGLISLLGAGESVGPQVESIEAIVFMMLFNPILFWIFSSTVVTTSKGEKLGAYVGGLVAGFMLLISISIPMTVYFANNIYINSISH